ncbi:hypothetical protein GOODEAATRI_009193, partial [Goodea atripinnis]
VRRVRVTLLARSTEYRRIRNQVEVSSPPSSCFPSFSFLYLCNSSAPPAPSNPSVIDLLPTSIKCLFNILVAIKQYKYKKACDLYSGHFLSRCSQNTSHCSYSW